MAVLTGCFPLFNGSSILGALEEAQLFFTDNFDDGFSSVSLLTTANNPLLGSSNASSSATTSETRGHEQGDPSWNRVL